MDGDTLIAQEDQEFGRTNVRPDRPCPTGAPEFFAGSVVWSLRDICLEAVDLLVQVLPRIGDTASGPIGSDGAA